MYQKVDVVIHGIDDVDVVDDCPSITTDKNGTNEEEKKSSTILV